MIKAEINKSKTHLEMRGAADDLIAEMACFVKAFEQTVLESVPEQHRNDMTNAINLLMLEVLTDARKEAEVSE